MQDSKVKPGLKVITTALEATTGMVIGPAFLNARGEGIKGIVMNYVPGHGGDVWYVRHDGTEDVGAYCFTELEEA